VSTEVTVTLIVTIPPLILSIVAFLKMARENKSQHGAGLSAVELMHGDVKEIRREVAGLAGWRSEHVELHKHLDPD
jgi:hypothetical protein